MKKITIIVLRLLYACIATIFILLYADDADAFTAHVTYTAPENLNYMTVVLVSEMSGDYSEAFGQRSEPGAVFVDIGNIKPETTYYFVAYRLAPDTWIASEYSDEVSCTSGAYAEPVVGELPPIFVGGDTFVITIEVNP